MADQGTQGGKAAVHEAGPILSGKPVEVATTKAPESKVLFGDVRKGIGCSRRGAH